MELKIKSALGEVTVLVEGYGRAGWIASLPDYPGTVVQGSDMNDVVKKMKASISVLACHQMREREAALDYL